MMKGTIHTTLMNLGHLKRELKIRWKTMTLEEQLMFFFAIERLVRTAKKQQLRTRTPGEYKNTQPHTEDTL